MMTDLAERLVAFAESGNQQRLRLRDGRSLQGWVMEVTGETLTLSVGGGESGQDHVIPFDSLDPAGLAYWDARDQSWKPFTL